MRHQVRRYVSLAALALPPLIALVWGLGIYLLSGYNRAWFEADFVGGRRLDIRKRLTVEPERAVLRLLGISRRGLDLIQAGSDQGLRDRTRLLALLLPEIPRQRPAPGSSTPVKPGWTAVRGVYAGASPGQVTCHCLLTIGELESLRVECQGSP